MLFEVVRIGAGIVGGVGAGYGTHMLIGKVFEGATLTTVEKGACYLAEAGIAAAAGKEAYRLCSFGRDLDDDEKMIQIRMEQSWGSLMSKQKATA